MTDLAATVGSGTSAAVSVYRDRVIGIGVAAVAAANGTFALLRIGFEHYSTNATPWRANALSCLVLLALRAWYLRRPASRAVFAIHGTAVVATLSLLLPLAYGYASSLLWLCLIAVAMLMMAGRAAAWSWVAVQMLLLVAASAWLHAHAGMLPPEPIQEQVASRIGFVVVLLFITGAFRYAVRAQSRALRETGTALEHSLAARERLLGRVGHELLTPLHGILGLTEQAIDAAPDPMQRRRIEGAHGAARVLLRRVNDLLEHAQGKAGPIELDNRPFELRRMLRESVDACAAEARGAGLRLGLRIGHEVIDRRRADEVRVRQMVLELVGNAIRNTPAGTVDVVVSAADSDSAMVVIDVIDSGVGMDEAQQAALLAPFVRGDELTSPRGGGLGLGFSAVRMIAAAMGGEVAVHSSPGRGTWMRVSVRLPEDTEHVRSQAVSRVSNPGLAVLVVDDDAVCRDLLCEYLRALGHEVQPVSDGEEAWSALQRRDYDAVITDLEMPRVDGRTLVHRIRAGARTGKLLPFVAAVSAGAFGSGREGGATREGFDACLSKPFGRADVLALLEGVRPAAGGRHAKGD